MTTYVTYPIILAHGIARFDVITNLLLRIDNDSADDGLHYFRNIRTHLMGTKRFDVHHSNVSWAADVEVRADDLKMEVEKVLHNTQAEKVHIIAHSMGGLDARHMLYKNRHTGFHHKVASLTTIGAPHHGTPAADRVLNAIQIDDDLVETIDTLGLGTHVAGFKNLTTEACEAFNEKAGEWERECGVQFRAYAGKQRYGRVFRLIRPFHLLIPTDNDGLVPVSSAKWHDDYFVPPIIDADHLNLTGWSDLEELPNIIAFLTMETKIKQLYLSIAEVLAEAFPI